MSRNPEYQFVDLDADNLVSDMVSVYKTMTGISVQPASPEKLFIQWVADIILQQRALINWAANQNVPSRAEGENLDAIAELFFSKTRPAAQAAICTMRFHISAAQSFDILIPAGTRVSDGEDTLVWETTEDVCVTSGNTSADVTVQCTVPGEVGNGFAVGQITTLVDVFSYYDHCSNINVSANGADAATDDEFYELIRASEDAYSDAGAKGGYIYWAKQVSTDIADVVANSPSAGTVKLYALMADGTKASVATKNAILNACNADDVRPLTDSVSVDDAELITYNIDCTYYIARSDSASATDIAAAVTAAVNDYKAWQAGKLGRDINPSKLISLLMATGIKRVAVNSPTYTALRDGSDNTVPQLASIGTVTVTNGGYEDE